LFDAFVTPAMMNLFQNMCKVLVELTTHKHEILNINFCFKS